MRCPVCTDVTLSISSREGIEIDHCPQCRGVWLDRGELDKIIERAAPSVVGTSREAPGAPAEPPRHEERPRYDERPRYEDRERHDDGYRYDKRRKRRSLLEEIFDFD